MTRVILASLFALLLPLSSAAQSPPDHLAWAKSAFVTAQVLDLSSTFLAVQSGQAREANPLLGSGYGWKAVGSRSPGSGWAERNTDGPTTPKLFRGITFSSAIRARSSLETISGPCPVE